MDLSRAKAQLRSALVTIPLVRAGGFKLHISVAPLIPAEIPLVRAGGFKQLVADRLAVEVGIPLVRAGGFKPPL